ncbi:MAG: threonine--tRNA ligase [Candidatus Pacearchaeota archaeon]|jgi:threonyl-tRNA synthetase
MKILCLHVDYVKFRALKKALKKTKDLNEDEKKEKQVKDALVVMTAVEKGESNVGIAVEKLINEIKNIAEQVNAKNVVLYPYAHLSKNLSSPETAIKVLEEAEKKLKKDFKVLRAPFGYYKEFEMKVKGHPLSELSREIEVSGNEVEEEYTKEDHERLIKRLSKVKMSTQKAPGGMKTNIELGRDLDLYIISEVVGPGLPLFTPKGATIKRELERFAIDEELKRGYLHTDTPIIAKSDLYKISGHWQHFKNDMFVLDVNGEKFALRPMTCPFQFVLYKRKPRSFKELPLKYAEIANLFRKEKSGELRGLTRVWQFKLADAHLICTPEQLEGEFEGVLDLIKYCMEKVGLNENDFWYRFSKWDPNDKKEKYIQNPKAWRSSEAMMKKILDKLRLKYVEAKGEAAFYGPKLDVQYKDVFGKEDTMFTIQIDFALPEKYDMTYRDKDNKDKRPMIIHRSSIGAPERLIACLLEKNQGNLKTWLSPVQVKILPMTNKNLEYAKKVFSKLKENNIRVEINERNESIGKRVRDTLVQKVPYIITVGDKEEKDKSLAIRVRGDKKLINKGVDDFVEELKKEISERL